MASLQIRDENKIYLCCYSAKYNLGPFWTTGSPVQRFLAPIERAAGSAPATLWASDLGVSLLPILDHQLELFHQGIDFFQIFPAPFLRLEIQGATKRNHVAEIAHVCGRQF